MTTLRQVNKDDIPQHIFDSISEYISWYTVGIRSIDENINENIYIGTGTLIDIEGRKGVLTAKHVSNRLKGANKVGLMISPNTHGYEIDKRYIEIVNVGDNLEQAKNIDLSVIIMPENLLGEIKANMSCYILSNKKDEILENSLLINEGVWALCGFPGEFEYTEGPQKGFDVVHGYIESCLFVNKIASEYICDDYDLVRVPISYINADKTVVPKRFGGVSGGGLWKFELYNVNGNYEVRRKILLGVAIEETEIKDNSRYIICHGWNSIYKTVYNSVILHR